MNSNSSKVAPAVVGGLESIEEVNGVITPISAMPDDDDGANQQALLEDSILQYAKESETRGTSRVSIGDAGDSATAAEVELVCKSLASTGLGNMIDVFRENRVTRHELNRLVALLGRDDDNSSSRGSARRRSERGTMLQMRSIENVVSKGISYRSASGQNSKKGTPALDRSRSAGTSRSLATGGAVEGALEQFVLQLSKREGIKTDADRDEQMLAWAAKEESDMLKENKFLRRRWYHRIGIISPHNPRRTAWNSAIYLLVIYYGMVVPLRLAFNMGEQHDFVEGRGFFLALDVAADIAFLLDVVISAHVAYYDGMGHLICDRSRIYRRYYASGELGIDIASALPISLLLASHDLSSATVANKVLKVGKLLRLLRVAPLLRLLRLAQTQRFRALRLSLLLGHRPNLSRVVNLLATLLFVMHYIACMYFAIARWEGFCDWNATSGAPDAASQSAYIHMR